MYYLVYTISTIYGLDNKYMDTPGMYREIIFHPQVAVLNRHLSETETPCYSVISRF